MRCVGLALHDTVPDAKTIWLFREQLARPLRVAKIEQITVGQTARSRQRLSKARNQRDDRPRVLRVAPACVVIEAQ
jgi:hypothetical protein